MIFPTSQPKFGEVGTNLTNAASILNKGCLENVIYNLGMRASGLRGQTDVIALLGGLQVSSGIPIAWSDTGRVY
jgi:hypothetical protein